MKKTIYCLFLILAVSVASCELPDNIDPKHALNIAPEAVFTQAEIGLVDQIGSISVNTNVTRLLVQYHSETTYVTESRYNFSDRQIPDAYFDDLYQEVLMNMKIAYNSLESSLVAAEADIKVRDNKLAIIEVCNVYTYQILVDAFGNVPYSEALMGAENSRPVYDDALTIYLDLIDRLDAAIALMDADYDSFGDADVIYGGDVALWKKFAATIKLRIALRLSDVPAAGSSSLVSEALATGVFEDQTESAICVYNGIAPYVNSYYNEFVLTARRDFVPTKTLVDKLLSLDDPRIATWITKYTNPVTLAEYYGEPYGLMGSSKYNNFSHFVDAILFDPKYPVILADYVEVEFLLAEAAERTLGGVTGAETHYNNAILVSMEYWGVLEPEALAYLANPDVAYSTAEGDYKEKIGTQKWLGLFDRGPEAWAEWRRLDYPILTPPQGMTQADIPMRMPYPFNENKQNKTNYEAASTAIGGDEASTKLFWDKH